MPRRVPWPLQLACPLSASKASGRGNSVGSARRRSRESMRSTPARSLPSIEPDNPWRPGQLPRGSTASASKRNLTCQPAGASIGPSHAIETSDRLPCGDRAASQSRAFGSSGSWPASATHGATSSELAVNSLRWTRPPITPGRMPPAGAATGSRQRRRATVGGAVGHPAWARESCVAASSKPSGNWRQDSRPLIASKASASRSGASRARTEASSTSPVSEVRRPACISAQSRTAPVPLCTPPGRSTQASQPDRLVSRNSTNTCPCQSAMRDRSLPRHSARSSSGAARPSGGTAVTPSRCRRPLDSIRRFTFFSQSSGAPRASSIQTTAASRMTMPRCSSTQRPKAPSPPSPDTGRPAIDSLPPASRRMVRLGPTISSRCVRTVPTRMERQDRVVSTR